MSSYDQQAADAARARQAQLTKPPGSLGRLEELAIFLAGWQGREKPRIDKAQAIIFAGNHGIASQEVSPFPAEVTALMVDNFRNGGAAINQLCRVAGADLSVVPLELDRPTGDFTIGPAMLADEVERAMEAGAAAIDPQSDILILGEMGIGNSTIAAVQAAAVFGGGAADWVGPGTGAKGRILTQKLDVVRRGLELYQPKSLTEALCAYGGREQAAICGAVVKARELGIPVILDGFICTAAAAVLTLDDQNVLEHCLIGHQSAEPGHRRLVNALQMKPILSLDMCLGEGSGAAVALMLLRAATECHNGMATFEEIGIAVN